MESNLQGSVKPRLLELAQQAQIEQQAFEDHLSDAQRAAYGSPDAWSAKDHIAHNTAWVNDATRLITAASQGETPEKSPSDVDYNPLVFAEHQQQSWEDVQSDAASANAALVDAIEACSEADLGESDRFPWREGNPLWMEAFISGFQHPGEHYAQFYIESGDRPRARAVREKHLSTARRVFGGSKMFSFMLYNTACFYVNNEQPDLAIGPLGEALAILPRLREWSKKDPDLAPLRDNPAFQALVSDSEPQATAE